jgi:hypothetical protein
VTAGAGSGTVTYASGDTIPAAGCTITVDVTSSTPGDAVNTITAGALQTYYGNNTAPASDTLTVTVVAPTMSKSFSPSSITAGSTSTLTISLGNTNASAATLSAILTDTLPAGMTVASTPNIGDTCGGTVTAGAGSGTVTYASGATIPSGGCTITVDVTSSTPGDAVNTIAAGALQTDYGNNAAPASDTLTVTAVAPTMIKSFSPSSITLGNTSTLAISLGNANATAATLSAVLTDTLPAGMTVATTPNIGGTCAGAVTAGAGSGTITYASGATIPAAGCTITVDVTSSTPGDAVNTIAAGALQTDYGNNAAPASDTLTVEVDLTSPAAITNLSVSADPSQIHHSTLIISWTAPGNDGATGTADSYDIRHDTSPITEGTWASATLAQGSYPTPQVANSVESFRVEGLDHNTTYYFAIKTDDEAANTSGISNSPSGTTGLFNNNWNMISSPETPNPDDTYINQFINHTGNSSMYAWSSNYTGSGSETEADLAGTWPNPGNITPGKGIIAFPSYSNSPLDTTGIPNSAATYTRPLDNGWNLVANPYPDNIYVSDCDVDDGGGFLPYSAFAGTEVGAMIYYWNGSTYTWGNWSTAVMEPWKAYWLFVDKSTGIILRFNKP